MLLHIRILLIIITLLTLPGACSKRPIYTNIAGLGACGNGIQDRGEIGVDCGGNCPKICTNIRYLEGEIFRRLSLNPYNEYVVTGPFVIRDKASLEIPAGTRLKVQADAGAYIAVMQGGSIFAWGTAKQPIIITSNAPDPSPGDWGGLIICGQAPIDQSVPSLSPLGYYYFGGNQQFDSSGYLKYVKIEYAGAAYDTLQNFNAVSFYGTGAYTSVDHLWIDQTQGTAIEINGGTMPLEKLYVTEGVNGVQINGNWQARGADWCLDANQQNGVSFFQSANSDHPTTPTSLHQLKITNPGHSGLHFKGFPQSLQISGVLIDSAPLALDFDPFESEDQWIENIQLDHIFINNCTQASNISYFNSLLNSQTNTAPQSLKQIPNWIKNWPVP